ncbi:hypothetical protein, partial [Bianquea renquensis]|uniref:hypothetical protein n=1 Tax=Bianquea renquensis TaxID=2763661 RepID=UPI002016732F
PVRRLERRNQAVRSTLTARYIPARMAKPSFHSVDFMVCRFLPRVFQTEICIRRKPMAGSGALPARKMWEGAAALYMER